MPLARIALRGSERAHNEVYRTRAQGARRLFFWSDTRFLGAHRFYEQLSYRRTGEERDLGDVSHSREYRFEKLL